jgi:hypothetical protein
VQRVVVEVVGGGDLHDLAEIHDRDPVGDVPHHREVVRDEEVRQVEACLEGFVFTYGTPGSVLAIYALIDLYSAARFVKLVSFSATSSFVYRGLLAGSPNCRR